jgi:hypothetical protein
MERTCSECRQPAARLRKGRCDACYMRQYRRGAPEPGDRCAACGERRLRVLEPARLGEASIVLCGNCALVLERTRPRVGTIPELAARVIGHRVPERRGRPAPTTVHVPSFDPSVD